MAKIEYEDATLTMAYIYYNMHEEQYKEIGELCGKKPTLSRLNSLLIASKYIRVVSANCFACLMGLQRVGYCHFNAWLVSTDNLDGNIRAVLREIRDFENEVIMLESPCKILARVPAWFEGGERLAEGLGFERDTNGIYVKDI